MKYAEFTLYFMLHHQRAMTKVTLRLRIRLPTDHVMGRACSPRVGGSWWLSTEERLLTTCRELMVAKFQGARSDHVQGARGYYVLSAYECMMTSCLEVHDGHVVSAKYQFLKSAW